MSASTLFNPHRVVFSLMWKNFQRIERVVTNRCCLAKKLTHLTWSTLSTFGTTSVSGGISHSSNMACRSFSASPLLIELILTAILEIPKSVSAESMLVTNCLASSYNHNHESQITSWHDKQRWEQVTTKSWTQSSASHTQATRVVFVNPYSQ